eukprot:6196671-Pleurochrysis_carterae.AAC.4
MFLRVSTGLQGSAKYRSKRESYVVAICIKPKADALQPKCQDLGPRARAPAATSCERRRKRSLRLLNTNQPALLPQGKRPVFHARMHSLPF